MAHAVLRHLSINDRLALKSVRTDMIGRCTNPKVKCYPHYGGRGIRVCDEWIGSPAAFYEWATEAGWQRGLTIDRKDVNGDYCPENCRWATWVEQSTNRTKPKTSLYVGVSKKRNRPGFIAAMRLDGAFFNIGYFRSEAEAAKAFDDAYEKYRESGVRPNNTQT